MTLIQEILSRRLFDENQKHKSSVLKGEWLACQCRNLLVSLLLLSVLLQALLMLLLTFQGAVFSIIVCLFLMIPTAQSIIILFVKQSSSLSISKPILKISLITHVLIGIIYSIFMIANIEGMVPKAHRTWLTGEDAINLLIQKYIARPILADSSVSMWMPTDKLDMMYQISLDEHLWIRVALLKILFFALILLSIFISIVATISLLNNNLLGATKSPVLDSKGNKLTGSTFSVHSPSKTPSPLSASKNSFTQNIHSPLPQKITQPPKSFDQYTDVSIN